VDECQPLLLAPLLEYLPDLVRAEILSRLGLRDLASLAGAGRGCAAAVSGTALMKWARAEKNLYPRRAAFSYPAPLLCVRDACALAARGGDLELLKWLHSTGCPFDPRKTLPAAAQGGYLEVLTWLHNQGCPLVASTCDAAAEGGHLEVLTWLHNTGCPWDSATCGGAAAGGHLSTLQWAREHHCPWGKSHVRACAARGGHVDMVRWLDEQGGP